MRQFRACSSEPSYRSEAITAFISLSTVDGFIARCACDDHTAIMSSFGRWTAFLRSKHLVVAVEESRVIRTQAGAVDEEGIGALLDLFTRQSRNHHAIMA